MGFKVSVLVGAPDYASLPAAKIIHYPLAKEDYRPFAQARICMSERGFFLQLIAFEVKIPPQSVLRADLSLSSSLAEKKLLSMIAGPAGVQSLSFWENGEKTDLPLPPESHPIQGEDLQGIYWGVHAFLSRALLEQLWPQTEVWTAASKEKLYGNFYKICPDPLWAHYGSFFPVDPLAFSEPPAASCLGELELVAY